MDAKRKERFLKLVGLMCSDQEGERGTAFRMAFDLLQTENEERRGRKQAELRWNELIEAGLVAKLNGGGRTEYRVRTEASAGHPFQGGYAESDFWTRWNAQARAAAEELRRRQEAERRKRQDAELARQRREEMARQRGEEAIRRRATGERTAAEEIDPHAGAQHPHWNRAAEEVKADHARRSRDWSSERDAYKRARAMGGLRNSVREMINQVYDSGASINDWEDGFMRNLYTQHFHSTLTDKQKAVLDKLVRKAKHWQEVMS